MIGSTRVFGCIRFCLIFIYIIHFWAWERGAIGRLEGTPHNINDFVRFVVVNNILAKDVVIVIEQFFILLFIAEVTIIESTEISKFLLLVIFY